MKVDKQDCCAAYVELVFQDQYLGRNDMWRLGKDLVGQCIYTDQHITFVGSIAAKIQNIYIGGKPVSLYISNPFELFMKKITGIIRMRNVCYEGYLQVPLCKNDDFYTSLP